MDAFLIKQIVVVSFIKWGVDAVEHGREQGRQHPLKSPNGSLGKHISIVSCSEASLAAR